MPPGAPLPLSAFLDAPAAPQFTPDPLDIADTAAAPPPPGIASSCLLTPDFLGCHLIASLGEELSLDGGRLRVWCGAALHNDHAAAAIIEAQVRARQKGAIEEKADTLFASAGASGSRLISVPYLRAAINGKPPLHVWLAPSVSQRLEASGERDAMIQNAAEVGADAERIIHTIGPYRLRVLSAEIIEGGAGADAGGLWQVETLAVNIAADKARVARPAGLAPDAAVSHHVAHYPLPRSLSKETSMWLSSQGVQQASFSAVPVRQPCAPSPPPTAPNSTDGYTGSALLPIACPSLPPIASPSSTVMTIDELSIDVALHATPLAPLRADSASKAGYGERAFGCDAWLWSVELSVMSLGGGSAEHHVTIPLHPTDAFVVPSLRLGQYELRVARCIGHHVKTALAAGFKVRVCGLSSNPEHNGKSGVVSGVQGERVQVRLSDGGELALRPANLEHVAADHTPGNVTAGGAILVSEYPLLLIHAELSLRKIAPQADEDCGGLDAVAFTDDLFSLEMPLKQLGSSLEAGSAESAILRKGKRKGKNEAKELHELGDAIEMMLGM